MPYQRLKREIRGDELGNHCSTCGPQGASCIKFYKSARIIPFAGVVLPPLPRPLGWRIGCMKHGNHCTISGPHQFLGFGWIFTAQQSGTPAALSKVEVEGPRHEARQPGKCLRAYAKQEFCIPSAACCRAVCVRGTHCSPSNLTRPTSALLRGTMVSTAKSW